MIGLTWCLGCGGVIRALVFPQPLISLRTKFQLILVLCTACYGSWVGDGWSGVILALHQGKISLHIFSIDAKFTVTLILTS